MNEISIYALVDPREPNIIRYVGQTLSPLKRLKRHCTENGTESRRCQWLDTIRSEGVMPQMIILKCVNAADADREERDVILNCASIHLTNEGPQAYNRLRDPVQPNKGLLRAGLDEIARRSIIEACEVSNWNMSKAARHLGISRPTLYDKIESFQIVRVKESYS